MTERYVIEALQEAVIASVLQSSDPDMSVKYLGRNFDPPANEPWLEVIHIPNDPNDLYWDKGKVYRGALRLLLHYPMKDVGVYPALSLLRSVSDYFEKGKKLEPATNPENVTVSITSNTNFLQPIEAPPVMLFPATIRYQYFKP